MCHLHAAPAGLVSEAAVSGQVEEAGGLGDAQLAVQLMERRAWSVPHDKVDTTVNGIALAFPGGCYPARHGVVFEDVAAIAVHLSVAAGGKTSQPSPNDDHGFLGHLFPVFDADQRCLGLPHG